MRFLAVLRTGWKGGREARGGREEGRKGGREEGRKGETLHP
jgi:hypothetical protein